MDTVRSSYCFKSSSCSASAVAVHLCCCASRNRERMRKRTISHIFVCCFHLVANSEKKSLGLYFNKVIINKWKETLETLEVVLILTSSCLDENELGLEVRLSLGKALNINGGRGRGWCLLCHTLCFGVTQAAVPRGAGERWRQEDKPMSAEPNPLPCCRQQWWGSHGVWTLLQLLASWASPDPWDDFLSSLFLSQQRLFFVSLSFFLGIMPAHSSHTTQPLTKGMLMGHSDLAETVAKAPCLRFPEPLGASQGGRITSFWLVNLLLPFCTTHSNTEA